MKKYSCVASIAGSDPSGGAGIQADIKAISANGCYAAAIITALTAQNTKGVQGILDVSPQFVWDQIESVFSDLTIDAVKIGMLHNEKIIEVVVRAILKFKPHHVVLDPVMISKSGSHLLKSDTIHYLKEHLLPLVSLVTPNLVEASELVDTKINTRHDMEWAAKTIGLQYNINVLLKGGHLEGNECADVLFQYKDKTFQWYVSERIISQNVHGTGCTLSAAIAAYLARNYSLSEAINLAKDYLTKAIQSGKEYKLGEGAGPVDHFFECEWGQA